MNSLRNLSFFGNKYEHNLLSEYDSAFKVIKEKEMIDNKRKAKANEKKATWIKNKFYKLLNCYKNTKRRWFEEGSASYENLIVSEEIEKSITEIAKKSQELFNDQILESTKLYQKLL